MMKTPTQITSTLCGHAICGTYPRTLAEKQIPVSQFSSVQPTHILKKKTSRLFILLFLGALSLSFTLRAETAGMWTSTGPMPTVRWGHPAILLPNGQVLVAGGSDGPSHEDTFASSAALYDPISNTWSPTGSMATRRNCHTLTLLGNGKVLAAGGANWGGCLASAEIYDYTTGLWTPTGPMPNVHNSHTATLLPSGKVLIVSGYDILPGCCYLGMIN